MYVIIAKLQQSSKYKLEMTLFCNIGLFVTELFHIHAAKLHVRLDKVVEFIICSYCASCIIMNCFCFMQPPVFAAYLYNAVYQYGVALNKTLAQYGAAARNKTPSGEEILSQLRDYTFDSEQFFLSWMMTIVGSCQFIFNVESLLTDMISVCLV